MEKVFNKKNRKLIRQRLRNTMTVPEILLWSRLKNKQLAGLKFRRQQGVGDYIADFYCSEKRLVVEIDGDSHYREGAIEKDTVRTDYFQRQGLRVIRFTNFEVRENLEGVLTEILKAADNVSS